MLQITYQKKDGSIIKRHRNTEPPYKIGQITSMGWKLLDIEYEYKNNYYSAYQYNILLQKDKNIYLRKKKAKTLFLKEMKTFIQYFIVLIILKCFT